MIPVVGQRMFMGFDDPRRRTMTNNGNRGDGHEVIVTKVGRKWATFYRADVVPEQRSHHFAERFDITNPRWCVDRGGFSYDARVWPDEAAYRREMARDAAYTAFRRALDHHYNLHPDVTAENIHEAARALGLGGEFEQQLKGN